MRILYITPSFHHPKLRGPSRHYYFIRELSRRHRITLLSLTRTPVPPEVVTEMRSYTDEIFTFGATTGIKARGGNPVASGLRNVAAFATRERAIAAMRETFLRLTREQSFDVVLFHGKPVFKVIDGWNALPIVADFCDATSMRYRARLREAAWLEQPLVAARYLMVRRVEQKLLKKTPHVAFISERDRRAVLDDDTEGAVIPLGIDLDYWTRSSPTAPQERCLIFTGVLDYQPNANAAVALVKRILPDVRRRMPDVELIIAGRNPSEELLALTRNARDLGHWFRRRLATLHEPGLCLRGANPGRVRDADQGPRSAGHASACGHDADRLRRNPCDWIREPAGVLGRL